MTLGVPPFSFYLELLFGRQQHDLVYNSSAIL